MTPDQPSPAPQQEASPSPQPPPAPAATTAPAQAAAAEPAPPEKTVYEGPSHIEDVFYEILSGQSRYAMFCSVVDLNLPALLGATGRTETEILTLLALDPLRGRKWLHMLRLLGFVEEQPGGTLRLSKELRAMFGEDGGTGYFYREFLRYFRVATAYPQLDVLRGRTVEHPVRYPPRSWDDIVLLHEWMRNTALVTLQILRKHVDFGGVKRLLDVGGGDGTMAMELWREYPNVSITVFNLPEPAALTMARVTNAQAWDRVRAVPGDFRTDELPTGFDMVMYSRVLADWPPELCRSLIRKAHASLEPGGRLVICEPMRDQNPALSLAWEHSYMPYDDFGVHLYKPVPFYKQMLEETGFRLTEIYPRDGDTIHCVLVAEKG